MPQLALLDQVLAWLGALWPYVTAIVTIASILVAGTPTPSPDTRIGRVYKVVEILSLTFGFAKQKGSTSFKPPDWPRPGVMDRLGAVMAVFLLAALLQACAVMAKPETPGQIVYAIESDFHLAQRAAVAYVERPEADPAVKQRIKQLEAPAYDGVDSARKAYLAGDSPGLAATLAAGRHAVGALVEYLVEKRVMR